MYKQKRSIKYRITPRTRGGCMGRKHWRPLLTDRQIKRKWGKQRARYVYWLKQRNSAKHLR